MPTDTYLLLTGTARSISAQHQSKCPSTELEQQLNSNQLQVSVSEDLEVHKIWQARPEFDSWGGPTKQCLRN